MVFASGTLEVNYDNHEKAIIKTGNYAFAPAKLPHSAYCQKGSDCVLFIGFVAPLDAMPIKRNNAK